MREGDDRIEPVAEFRREQPIDRFHVVTFTLLPREAERRACAMSDAPALVVMIRMTLRKSTCLPL